MSCFRLRHCALLSSRLTVLGLVSASRDHPLPSSHPPLLDRHHHLFPRPPMAAAGVPGQEGTAMAHFGGSGDLVDRSAD